MTTPIEENDVNGFVSQICFRLDGSIEAICIRLVDGPDGFHVGVEVNAINIRTNQVVLSSFIPLDGPCRVTSVDTVADATLEVNDQAALLTELIPLCIKGVDAETGKPFTTLVSVWRMSQRWLFVSGLVRRGMPQPPPAQEEETTTKRHRVAK